MASDTPAPGAQAALDAGCTCQIRWSAYPNRVSQDSTPSYVTNWIEWDEHCPLHGEKTYGGPEAELESERDD